MCQASFAVASVIAPPDEYPYEDEEARAPIEEVLQAREDDLPERVSQAAMGDVVTNTAMVWRHIWTKVSRPG